MSLMRKGTSCTSRSTPLMSGMKFDAELLKCWKLTSKKKKKKEIKNGANMIEVDSEQLPMDTNTSHVAPEP